MAERRRFNFDAIPARLLCLMPPSCVSTYFLLLNLAPCALDAELDNLRSRSSARQSGVAGKMASTKRTANFTIVGLPTIV